jgi:hypothetical protein
MVASASRSEDPHRQEQHQLETPEAEGDAELWFPLTTTAGRELGTSRDTTGKLSPLPPRPAKKARRLPHLAPKPAPRSFIWGEGGWHQICSPPTPPPTGAPWRRKSGQPAADLGRRTAATPRQDARKRRRARQKNYPTLDLLRRRS